MLTGSHENISQESLQIKQDNKFFSRLMSKETSMANSSSRVYYRGASGSVPFTWESQPGTPKHTMFNDNTLPPLTPPPSFQSISRSNTIQKNAKPNHLLSYIFGGLTRSKKNHVSPSSSSWSCTSSSSSSSCSSSNLTNSKKSKFHRHSSSFTSLPMTMHFHNEEDQKEKNYGCSRGSPTSTLCFSGDRNKRRSLSISKGCYSMMKMKKALLPIIVGHGSGQGTTA